VFTSLTRFVCSAYCPIDINISNIPELRWHLFCENMAENDFTKLLVHYGSISCEYISKHMCGDKLQFLTMQIFLDPLKHGCHKVNWSHGPLKPTTTDVLQALKTVTEMVRCQCKTDWSSQRCSCHAKNLTCTDLCVCSTSCENGEDWNIERQDHDSDDDATNDEWLWGVMSHWPNYWHND